MLFAGKHSAAAGRTFRIPEDEPAATVQIPDDWPTKEHGEFFESSTRDGSCRLMLVPPEGSKVGESIAEAIRYVRRNGTIAVRPGLPKKEKSSFNGREMTVMSWDASENGKPIVIRCYIVPIGRADSFVALVWGSGEAQKRYGDAINKIVRSLATLSRTSGQ
jgi:hypothetical protein